MTSGVAPIIPRPMSGKPLVMRMIHYESASKDDGGTEGNDGPTHKDLDGGEREDREPI